MWIWSAWCLYVKMFFPLSLRKAIKYLFQIQYFQVRRARFKPEMEASLLVKVHFQSGVWLQKRLGRGSIANDSSPKMTIQGHTLAQLQTWSSKTMHHLEHTCS